MNGKKQYIFNFIQDYYSEYNSFIEDYIQNISGDENEDNQLKENLFNNLIELKKSIPSKLADYGLKDSDLSFELKKEHAIISLIQNIYKKYDLNLNEKVTQNIFDTTILGTQDINKKEVEKYIKKINNYTNDQIINNLYDLAFISDENEDNDNFKISFAKFFKESLVKLKTFQKAELYSQLNVFLEEYTKTPLGKKHIEILQQQYLKDTKSEYNKTDQKYAVKNWMMNILSAYNACTPTENNILIDKDEQIKIKTAKGGTFDALLFINTTPIPDDRKKEFESITKIEELNKFKASISNISQYQISATSDKGFNIESSSVLKHCLSSLVINKILNLQHIIYKEDGFIDLFSMKNDKDDKFNQNMKGAITHAIKTICPELVQHLFDDKKDINGEDFFINIQQKMNENPILFIDYLNNKYSDNSHNKDNLIRDNIHLTQSDMEIFNNLEKEHDLFQNRPAIFKNKSMLCLFRIEEAYSNKKFDIEMKIPLYLRNEVKKQHLSTNDVILLIQFNSIVKSSYFGSESVDNKSIIRIIDNSFDIRGIGLKNKYNNELLEKFKIEDIDQLILHNFVYSKNALSNLKNLNKQDMENTVQCIILYFDSASQEDKVEIFEKLKEHSKEVKYLRDSLNKGKSIDKITDITDKINEIKELHKKIEEKDLIIEKERKANLEKDLIIEKERKANLEKDKEKIIDLVNSVLESEITDKYFYKKINENKNLFNLFSSKEIQQMKKDLHLNHELLDLFNNFLKENDLFQVNSKDLLNENFNNDIKAKEVIEEITVFINNSQNKKYKKEEEFGSTTRLENLFLSIESKIENKEILEMVKNSIEEYKNHYPQIWKKLESIQFEESINTKILKNNF